MNKAILIIDMPESFKDCMCYVLGASCNFCEITRQPIFDNTTKLGNCPLKPLPSTDEYAFGDWDEGYQACLEDILGD